MSSDREQAKLIDYEHWSWYLHQTADGTLWLSVLRTSKTNASAMYELIRRVEPDHPEWTATVDRDWVDAQIKKMYADEKAHLGANESAAYRALEFEMPPAPQTG